MLAIISDLHLCDGTATERNVQPQAFTLALNEIYDQAAPIVAREGSAHIDLVMLGDVFDLLRTERWFEDDDGQPVPLEGRPWGSADAAGHDYRVPEPVILRARAILEKIIQVNEESLAILNGKGKKDDRITVRRILLPGNHDRLALHDEALYARMRQALGAADERTLASEGIFPHHLEMRPYGVLARHGHEWDPWNFEAHEDGRDPTTYSDHEYLGAPIGDPITTELAARLPYEMKRRLAREPGLTDEDRLLVYRRMQRIEDVRPLFASLQWAYVEASKMPDTLGETKGRLVHDAAREVLQALVAGFRKLDFYSAWIHRHHRFFSFGPPDQLAAALRAVELVTPDTLGRLAETFGKALDGATEQDPYRAAAGTEQLAPVGAQGLRFVVYGHTHDPVQAALAAGATQDLYLNSGTFRQRVFRTDDKQGFVGSEHISYLCFFRDDEASTWRRPGDDAGPAYQAWMGARSR